MNNINSICMLTLWFLLEKISSVACCFFNICMEDQSQYSCGTHSRPNLSLVSTTCRDCFQVIKLFKIIITFIKKGKLAFHWCRSAISFCCAMIFNGIFFIFVLPAFKPFYSDAQQISINRSVVWLKLGVKQNQHIEREIPSALTNTKFYSQTQNFRVC